jgi:hypothetical protein
MKSAQPSSVSDMVATPPSLTTRESSGSSSAFNNALPSPNSFNVVSNDIRRGDMGNSLSSPKLSSAAAAALAGTGGLTKLEQSGAAFKADTNSLPVVQLQAAPIATSHVSVTSSLPPVMVPLSAPGNAAQPTTASGGGGGGGGGTSASGEAVAGVTNGEASDGGGEEEGGGDASEEW